MNETVRIDSVVTNLATAALDEEVKRELEEYEKEEDRAKNEVAA